MRIGKDVFVTSHRSSNSSWYDVDPGAKGIPKKTGCGSSSLSTGVYYELGKDGVKREPARFLGRISVESARRRNLLVRPAPDVYAGEELCPARTLVVILVAGRQRTPAGDVLSVAAISRCGTIVV